MEKTLCVIYEAIGDHSAIAKIAKGAVCTALAAGWRVTVVAKFLDKSLQGEVEWLRLYVPPKFFFVKWVGARSFIRAALGGRKFDVLHVYQPQVASLADIMHCQYLTRVAAERNCLESRTGLRPAIIRMQQKGALRFEDYYFRNWNPHTRMLFCSELVQSEFHRLYGRLPREAVLSNTCPPINFPSDDERRRARRVLLGRDYDGLVAGYIGGVDERKGYRSILKALEGDNDILLLMGGPDCEGFTYPALGNRFKSVGGVSDINTFYAACDVLLVPSYFDPCPLVCFEAASRGVPVIATEGVGNLPTLLRYGAGEAWERSTPLEPIVRQLASRREAVNDGARRMLIDLSARRQGDRLLDEFDAVREEKLSAGQSGLLNGTAVGRSF